MMLAVLTPIAELDSQVHVHELQQIRWKNCQILVEKLEKNENDNKSEKYNVISVFTYTP